MQTTPTTDRRRQTRTRVSDRVMWRQPGLGTLETAWMLEQSDDGLAFAWRGDRTPTEGDLIEIQRSRAGRDCLPERAVVRRVRHAHEDMFVIGAEIVRTKTAALAAGASATIVEPHPFRSTSVEPDTRTN